MSNELNIDISPAEEARALHRVVRAMHDGHCPACGHLGPSEEFYNPPAVDSDGDPYHCPKGIHEGTCGCPWPRSEASHRCPECGFAITEEEATAALSTFRQFMERNLAVFENWRSRRQA